MYTLDPFLTLIVATLTIFLGRYLTKEISFLRKYTIPEPVTGGLVISLFLMLLYYYKNIVISFDANLKDICMLMFFASIGLSADFKHLKAGGKPLLILIVLVSVFIIFQNSVGVGLTYLFDKLEPLHGLVLGSITLTGGHSTAGAWGPVLESKYHLTSATALGVAAATYGLIAGGLIGGPVASLLLKKVKLAKETESDATSSTKEQEIITFENPDKVRLITATAVLEALAMFAICLSFAYFMTQYIETHYPNSKFTIPSFVWALACGIVIRNILSGLFKYPIFDRCIDVIGNVSLSLFLAIALVSLKLWELSELGYAIIVVLLIQTIIMASFAYFITFRFMGKDYDAAVIAAGHCGFGLGATPTAVANMQAVTERYGHSAKAFLIIPLVGAFFVDIFNALILPVFMSIFT